MTLQDNVLHRERLSKRALEILQLLAEGLTDREIAERLFMTVNTIKWYNHQTYSILGVNNRTQAILRATEMNLLDDDDPDAEDAEVDSSASRKHNLMAETTRFIGRKREVSEISKRLLTTRLLTLLGSPGTGKTRLALHVARQMLMHFRDGVYFVSLAPITEVALVPNAIADALGVKQTQGESLLETLKQALQNRHLLLILDNCEHVLAAAAAISDLLAAAADVKILATSREPLHLYGEQEYSVPPLELPNPEQVDIPALEACEAGALFIQQARAVRADFMLTQENAQDIAKICVRLEGLPLAIELAAARIKILTPHTLLARLSNRLDTLTGGAHDLPTRQQTLRNTIDWSYKLLDPVEQILFARLAVFAGGWTLDAAEAVAGENLPMDVLDGLASLLDKSLIHQTDDTLNDPRFMMLETIREYALERLQESGQEEPLRASHAAYYTTYAERTGRALLRRYRSMGLSELEVEQNNFRAVLHWSLSGHIESGLRLIAALGTCWRVRSYIVEGYEWSKRLLTMPSSIAPEVRANALSSTSRLVACYMGDYDEAVQMSGEALALARMSTNTRSIAGALFAHGAALMATDTAAARSYFEEALPIYEEASDPWNIAQMLNVLGEVARMEGNAVEAERLYHQALALFRQYGNPWGANIVFQNLAHIAHDRGDYAQSQQLFTEGLMTSQELGDRLSIADCLVGLAGVLVSLQCPEQAARLFGSGEAMRELAGASIQAADRPAYDRYVAIIQAQLGTSLFERAWEEGRRMSVAAALSGLPPDTRSSSRESRRG
jgi:predicted ATPase/DNA-binding CsgD family transcriptional regulator